MNNCPCKTCQQLQREFDERQREVHPDEPPRELVVPFTGSAAFAVERT